MDIAGVLGRHLGPYRDTEYAPATFEGPWTDAERAPILAFITEQCGATVSARFNEWRFIKYGPDNSPIVWIKRATWDQVETVTTPAEVVQWLHGYYA